MKVAVIGLGYVGLPVAVAFAEKYPETVGFDINTTRIDELKNGIDQTGECSTDELKNSPLKYTFDPEELSGADLFIVGVPTPVDENHSPDLSPLEAASITVGKAVKEGSVVVFESTVYPGVTEEFCGPIIEKTSGLTAGKDFFLGYSPERINPGDREHTFKKITKVIAGQDEKTLNFLDETYSSVVTAGVHRAPSIKVAEAAKVIENTQRDLNIALMNELSIIFDKMNIRTADVLEAAGTKWNFIKFFPGLVGGHCIGVDPYYLTTAAERLGYNPEVILAGRKINDQMGKHVAQRAIKLMVKQDLSVSNAKIGVFGVTFKEDISDTRNSRVPDIIRELKDFGCDPIICDPCVDKESAEKYYGFSFTELEEISALDVIILAVPHKQFIGDKDGFLKKYLKPNGILLDVKSVYTPECINDNARYWSL